MHIFSAFLSGLVVFYIIRLFPFLGWAALAAAAAILLFRKKYLLAPLIVAGFLYAGAGQAPDADPLLLNNRDVLVDCITKGSQHETASGKRANRAELISMADMTTGMPLSGMNGREIIIISDPGLRQDMRYKLHAKTGKDVERLNPGSFANSSFNVYLEGIQSEAVYARNPAAVWLEYKRNSLTQYLKDNFKGDSGHLLAAITTGEWSGMSDGLKDAFSTTGLAHILSISGTHFGLFSMLVFGLFRLLIRLMPYRLLQRFTIWLTPAQAAAILSLPFMLMYLLISGSSLPAVRSFIMINVFLFGLLLGRKGFWLNSLLFAAFLICLWEPSSISDLSFQLSFLAVLFIGLSAGGKEEDAEDNVLPETAGSEGMRGRMLKYLKDSVRITLFVSLGTAPLVAYYFHYFSVISPLTNLIITPFIGFVLVAVSLMAGFVFIFTGYYPFHSLVAMSADLSIKGVKLFASLPFADLRVQPFPLIVAAAFYAGIALYIANRVIYRFRGRNPYAIFFVSAAALIFFLNMINREKGMSVTYLDVGQGDSAVVEAGGKVIAMDTGRTGRELYSYLRYLGRRDIDAVVLTHADNDHSAGIAYLTGKIKVREIWDSGLLVYPEKIEGTLYRHFERGDLIAWDRVNMHILHPYKGFYTFSDAEAAEENNNSLVIKVSGLNSSFLFAADAAEEAEEDMTNLGSWLKSDVLKIAHHGSRFSTTGDFLSAAAPKIAVISVGRHNTYGHPHKETLERLEGIRVYRTDRDGAIKITETSDGLSVKTYRDFRFERASGLSGEWRNIKRLFMVW